MRCLCTHSFRSIAGSAGPDADAGTEREHGRWAGVARRRSVPAAPERAVAGRVHPQRAAPARGSERLSHRRPASRRRAAQRGNAHRGRLARPLQVVQRRPDLAEHADPRISAGSDPRWAAFAAQGLHHRFGSGGPIRHQWPLLLRGHRLQSSQQRRRRLRVAVRRSQQPRERQRRPRRPCRGQHRPHPLQRHLHRRANLGFVAVPRQALARRRCSPRRRGDLQPDRRAARRRRRPELRRRQRLHRLHQVLPRRSGQDSLQPAQVQPVPRLRHHLERASRRDGARRVEEPEEQPAPGRDRPGRPPGGIRLPGVAQVQDDPLPRFDPDRGVDRSGKDDAAGNPRGDAARVQLRERVSVVLRQPAGDHDHGAADQRVSHDGGRRQRDQRLAGPALSGLVPTRRTRRHRPDHDVEPAGEPDAHVHRPLAQARHGRQHGPDR